MFDSVFFMRLETRLRQKTGQLLGFILSTLHRITDVRVMK